VCDTSTLSPTLFAASTAVGLSGALIASVGIRSFTQMFRKTSRARGLQFGREQIEATYQEAEIQAAVADPEVIPTSSKGKAAALAILQFYMRDLLKEASVIARRAGPDHPSEKHVDIAADRLGLGRSRAGVAADVTLALGSILLGGGSAYQVNIWTGSNPKEGTAMYEIIVVIAGAFMLGLAGAWKWIRR